MISGVVTVLGRPGRGSSQVEKSPRLKTTTEFFFTVAYDGACSPNVSVRTAEFPLSPCAAGEKFLDGSLRLHVVETARVACHTSFSHCNKKYLQYSTRTTIDSVYDIGK